MKHILRYIKDTIDYGHFLTSNTDFTLTAYLDSDLATCSITRRSTNGYCTFLGTNCLSWLAKKQPAIGRSSTEAEYRANAATAEITLLIYLLTDFRIPLVNDQFSTVII